MANPNDVSTPVPYTSRLGEPLQAGQTLNVHGKINDGAQSVEINLLEGSREINENVGSAIFHLRLRFDEKKVVMNSFTGGVWGKEERESLHLKAGDEFDIRIRILEEALEVSINGKEVHNFKHRLPFQTTQFVQVKGDCTLNRVHWGGRFYDLPWETQLPHGGLRAGQRIYLYGVPNGKRWAFDLLATNGDILFHFNPRFDQKVVVRNNNHGGTWGNEEREGPFPFEKNVGFDLTIVNEQFSIQIFVNNQRIGTWAHRTQNPDGDYQGLRISGDIELTGIQFSH